MTQLLTSQTQRHHPWHSPILFCSWACHRPWPTYFQLILSYLYMEFQASPRSRGSSCSTTRSTQAPMARMQNPKAKDMLKIKVMKEFLKKRNASNQNLIREHFQIGRQINQTMVPEEAAVMIQAPLQDISDQVRDVPDQPLPTPRTTTRTPPIPVITVIQSTGELLQNCIIDYVLYLQLHPVYLHPMHHWWQFPTTIYILGLHRSPCLSLLVPWSAPLWPPVWSTSWETKWLTMLPIPPPFQQESEEFPPDYSILILWVPKIPQFWQVHPPSWTLWRRLRQLLPHGIRKAPPMERQWTRLWLTLCFILFCHLGPRTDAWLPIPHPARQPCQLPGTYKDTPDFINSGYTIDEWLLTDHVQICQRYSGNIEKFTRYNHNQILDTWKISFGNNQAISPARITCIPWDTLAASSAIMAIDRIDESLLPYIAENFKDGFMEMIIAI